MKIIQIFSWNCDATMICEKWNKIKAYITHNFLKIDSLPPGSIMSIEILVFQAIMVYYV